VLEALMHMGAFGLGAIRCRPDPSFGEIVGHYPIDENGRMRVKDAEQFAGENYAGAGGRASTPHRSARAGSRSTRSRRSTFCRRRASRTSATSRGCTSSGRSRSPRCA
jgi:hypothetical protein